MFHDAAATVVDSGKIVFAGHAERYSGVKNDAFLCRSLIQEALSHGKPDCIALHEVAWAKRARNILAGNWSALREPTQQQYIEEFYPELRGIPVKSYWHHETHAAAGVLTSDFSECAVMVIDAIGEFNTATIWHWSDGQLAKLHSVNFPNSLGLFYSAATQHVGLKPMEDEYILMGMAAYGKPVYQYQLLQTLFSASNKDSHAVVMRKNLQRGWPSNLLPRHGELDSSGHYAMDYDIAASAQAVVEERVLAYARHAQQLTGSANLVFMGGVALNCVANSKLFDVFDQVHIMPNPGDAGSSLGAAALHYYNTTAERVKWCGPYLGTNIPGAYPVNKALESLSRGEIFGIANGRAEFGPRALGNRSLMADPRGDHIKDKLNLIKRRQKFRPFAPVILEEYADQYFQMPKHKLKSPYMQFVAPCLQPELFPAIVHADGTSRVQTVNQYDHPGLYLLLREFYKRTGCPMLVNTSLNIKGEPIVNTVADAHRFAEYYRVAVHTHD